MAASNQTQIKDRAGFEYAVTRFPAPNWFPEDTPVSSIKCKR